jgi:hypothetical protein
LLEVIEIDVLEVSWWLALYSTIDRSKTSKRTKINQIKQQAEEYQQYDVMAR